jgi:hypothetical protein
VCVNNTGSAGPDQGEEQQAVLGFSAAALSRFFFVLGRTGLHHLLHIEQLGKAIRAARLAASRAAAEASERAREAAASAAAAAAKPGKRGSKAAAAAAAAAAQQAAADDIGSMLGGAGAVAADAELDDLTDMLEAQVRWWWQQQRYGCLLCAFVCGSIRRQPANLRGAVWPRHGVTATLLLPS